MPDHDDRLAQSLRAWGADIVLTEDLEHRRARHTHRYGGVPVADSDRRQDESREARDWLAPQRGENHRRRPAPERQRDEDHHDPDPEAGHRESADAEDAYHVVDPAVLLHGGHDAEWDRERDREERRQQGELDRKRAADAHLL